MNGFNVIYDVLLLREHLVADVALVVSPSHMNELDVGIETRHVSKYLSTHITLLVLDEEVDSLDVPLEAAPFRERIPADVTLVL